MNTDNPWGVTPGQAKCLDAVIEHGSHKAAASALGLAPRTVEDQLRRAARNIRGEKVDRVTHLIQWDRFRRGGK